MSIVAVEEGVVRPDQGRQFWEGNSVKRRLVAAAAIVGTATAIAVPVAVMSASSAPSAAGICVHLSLNVNGTAQNIDQCLPPA